MARLSAAAADGLRKPGKYCVGRGLYLIVVTAQCRYWFFRYKRSGFEHYMSLGHVDDITLAEASAKAREARRLLLEGIDPLAEKRRSGARCWNGKLAKKRAADVPPVEAEEMSATTSLKTPESATPTTMRVTDAAKYLSISESMIRKLLRDGRLASVNIGARKLILTASLDRLIA